MFLKSSFLVSFMAAQFVASEFWGTFPGTPPDPSRLCYGLERASVNFFLVMTAML